jgi:repressor LexA
VSKPLRMASRRPLTKRQADVLDFIRESLRVNGMPPTLREIGAHFDIASTNGVNDHLEALVAKGRINVLPGRARGIQLVGDAGGACPHCSGTGHAPTRAA